MTNRRAPRLGALARNRPLLARTFARRLGLLHPFRHLGFHGIEVEARAALHWRVIEEGLECLADHLLDENEAPELILEPCEVGLRPFFRPLVWPAYALERIKAQVGDVRHVNMCLFPQPA